MARTLMLPPPPRMTFVKRATPLDASDPDVFDRWCASPGNETLEEFCEGEWFAARIAPPPPSSTPGTFVRLDAGIALVPMPPVKPVMPPNRNVIG